MRSLALVVITALAWGPTLPAQRQGEAVLPSGAEVYRRASVATALVEIDGEGQGCGFVCDPAGLAVSAYHLLELPPRQDAIALAIPPGVPDGAAPLARHPVRVAAVDSRRDVLVLAFEPPEGCPALELAPDGSAATGDPVYAIGNPTLAGTDLSFSLSQGIVSFRFRRFEGVPYLQTDVAINPGSSGGPLLDRAGRVVGMIAMQGIDQQGLGFALPVEEMRDVLARAREAAADDEGARRTAERWVALLADGKTEAAGDLLVAYHWNDQAPLYGEMVDYVRSESAALAGEGLAKKEIEDRIDEALEAEYGVPHSSRILASIFGEEGPVERPAIQRYLVEYARASLGNARRLSVRDLSVHGALADATIRIDSPRGRPDRVLRLVRDSDGWCVVPYLPPQE
ncbi:MAG: serine protease [Planctomycetes bacterium]|nr:serine protease [Planctomycetota bacterium]